MTVQQKHDPKPEPITMTLSGGKITSVPVRVKKPITLIKPDGEERIGIIGNGCTLIQTFKAS